MKTKNERTRQCEELMRPEVKKYLNLPLEEKIEVTSEIIKKTIEKYPKIAVGFSGGTDSLVVLHIILKIKPDIKVIFVNTRHQFPETYKFIDKVRKEWNLTDFHEFKPKHDKLEEIKKKHGFKTPEFTEFCCSYHKIEPLLDAINNLELDAFINGIRGVEHEERAKESFFSERDTHIRVHPLLFWTQDDILEYVKMFGIDANPMYAEGYTSLGCVECTEKNLDPDAHERAGRGVVREKIMSHLRDLGYT